MGRIQGTKVVKNYLQVTGVGVGGVGQGFAVAAMLGLHPAVHRVLHIEQGTGMRAAADGAEGDPQGIGDGMGQAAIGAGGDIEQVKAALQQEGFECLGGLAAPLALQGILLKEGGAGLLKGLEHAPGEQGAHVELGHPGPLQDRQGKLITQLGAGELLGPDDKIILVLQGGELFEHRHDPVERFFHPVVIGLKPGIGASIAHGMKTSRRPSPGTDAHQRRAGGLKRSGSGRRGVGPQTITPHAGQPIAQARGITDGTAPGCARGQRAVGDGRTAGHRALSPGPRPTP